MQSLAANCPAVLSNGTVDLSVVSAYVMVVCSKQDVNDANTTAYAIRFTVVWPCEDSLTYRYAGKLLMCCIETLFPRALASTDMF